MNSEKLASQLEFERNDLDERLRALMEKSEEQRDGLESAHSRLEENERDLREVREEK